MEPCLFRHGKVLTILDRQLKQRGLQWSHVFSDMVSLVKALGLLEEEHASMEPCLFRHGKDRFGLETFCKVALQWSHVFSDMVRVRIAPLGEVYPELLQWSHVFSDMVSEMCVLRCGKWYPLQWSHVFSDMVRIGRDLDLPRGGMLQWSHVFSDMVRT